MTKNRAEELRAELALLEKEESVEAGGKKHNLTIMQDDEQVDVETLPKKRLNSVEKSKIVTQIAVLNEIKEELMDIINDDNATVSDWLMVLLVLDEISTEVLGIVYDVKGTLIPSLPNFDLLVMFLEENQSWIGDKAKLAITQINAISEEAMAIEEAKKEA
ncbi:hypothetical protein [Enterococcus sp. AZ163]|uniref:hypothetical protein n=1 Tax=Enterococcus sp. AZ163 TaxID=2774638 RepID=UPI003D2DA1F0